MSKEIKTFIVVAIMATIIGVLFGKIACVVTWLVGMVWCLVVAKEEWNKLIDNTKNRGGQYE